MAATAADSRSVHGATVCRAQMGVRTTDDRILIAAVAAVVVSVAAPAFDDAAAVIAAKLADNAALSDCRHSCHRVGSVTCHRVGSVTCHRVGSVTCHRVGSVTCIFWCACLSLVSLNDVYKWMR